MVVDCRLDKVDTEVKLPMHFICYNAKICVFRKQCGTNIEFLKIAVAGQKSMIFSSCLNYL